MTIPIDVRFEYSAEVSMFAIILAGVFFLLSIIFFIIYLSEKIRDRNERKFQTERLEVLSSVAINSSNEIFKKYYNKKPYLHLIHLYSAILRYYMERVIFLEKKYEDEGIVDSFIFDAQIKQIIKRK